MKTKHLIYSNCHRNPYSNTIVNVDDFELINDLYCGFTFLNLHSTELLSVHFTTYQFLRPGFRKQCSRKTII